MYQYHCLLGDKTPLHLIRAFYPLRLTYSHPNSVSDALTVLFMFSNVDGNLMHVASHRGHMDCHTPATSLLFIHADFLFIYLFFIYIILKFEIYVIQFNHKMVNYKWVTLSMMLSINVCMSGFG